ncbi:AEC family transporter [Phascolarctobacterium sp.]|uniref:AEC family transporter n=1 Tax=Phascolarctobacterium sp. TaxID=2049039 RepID=UPI00386B9030
MLEVLSKAAAFILMILIGYYSKKKGMFTPTDYQLVAKIILNITLPCAVISSFAHFQMDYSLFAAVVLGLLLNIFMLLVALLLTKRDTNAAKIFYIFSLAGCNIGCFTMPFVQAFLTPFAVIAICMFDVGNSIMCTGMTYALTASCIGYADGTKDKFNVRNIVDKLLHSAPFMVYISMLALSVAGVHFPAPVYTFTNLVGAANPFLSMLMIGMMFEIKLDRRSLGYIKELFAVRYGVCLALAGACLYFAPFAQEVNYVIALGILAPCTIIGPIFVEKLGGNVQLASLFNSITIVVSVLLFTMFFIVTNS